MEDLDQVKGEVWSKLVGLSLNELTEITTGLSLTVPEAKKDLKSAVYGAVVKHLMSDAVETSDDDELQLFKLVNTIMDQVLKKRPEIKVEVPAADNQVGGGSSASSSNATAALGTPVTTTPPAGTDGGAPVATTSAPGSVVPASVSGSTPISTVSSMSGYAARTESPVELAMKLLASLSSAKPQMTTSVQQSVPVAEKPGRVQRLKDFTIKGVIGGGEGQLDYVALKYRIKEGFAKGYELPDIISGVIGALKPGSELRRFFEVTPDVSEEKFNRMIKSHYKIQSATNCLTELTSCVQEPTQGDRDYITKMMRLKNTLLVVGEEEGFHMNPEMIYQSFIDAVSVGLRNRGTRLELQPFLEKKLEDEDLSWEVNKIVTRDEEYRRKMRGPKNVAANALDAEETDHVISENNPAMTKEDIIISELRNLSSDMKELKTVKKDVKVMQERMDGYDKKLEDLSRKVDAGKDGDKKNGSDGTDKRKRFDFKCEECQAANRRYCPHCNKCGESDHKRKDCTKN